MAPCKYNLYLIPKGSLKDEFTNHQGYIEVTNLSEENDPDDLDVGLLLILVFDFHLFYLNCVCQQMSAKVCEYCNISYLPSQK